MVAYLAPDSQPTTNPSDSITNSRVARGMETVANNSFVSTFTVFCRAIINTRRASMALVVMIHASPDLAVELLSTHFQHFEQDIAFYFADFNIHNINSRVA